MDDGLYLPSMSIYLLPTCTYLPVRFRDPVCKQGIISKSPTDVTDLAMYLVACSYTHIQREEEHIYATNKNVPYVYTHYL